MPGLRRHQGLLLQEDGEPPGGAARLRQRLPVPALREGAEDGGQSAQARTQGPQEGEEPPGAPRNAAMQEDRGGEE